MDGDLVSLAVGFLDSGIVAVLVWDEEGGLDVAAVWVLALAIKHFLVEFDVVVVDGIIEGDGDHLRDVLGGQVPGNCGTIFRAEAIGQHAHCGVAGGSTVGIIVDIWNKFEINNLLVLNRIELWYVGKYLKKMANFLVCFVQLVAKRKGYDRSC